MINGMTGMAGIGTIAVSAVKCHIGAFWIEKLSSGPGRAIDNLTTAVTELSANVKQQSQQLNQVSSSSTDWRGESR
ncbi:hypothetical protein DL769_005505 [Monosporascus sp. CRB-8-3]|nr:hypothetical protein DL769_005505 [Monosporascus sp. CRB-8-3]